MILQAPGTATNPILIDESDPQEMEGTQSNPIIVEDSEEKETIQPVS